MDSTDFRTVKQDYVYLSISLCNHSCDPYGGSHTIYVFMDRGEALKAKDFIDRLGCGGMCSRLHYVVKMKTKTAAKMKRMGFYRRNHYIRWVVENRPHEN